MTTDELWNRVWQRLDPGASLFFPPAVVVNLGRNLVQRLLVLQKPSLLVRRVHVDLVPDQTPIDLREVAPRAYQVQRVALGDVTMGIPAQPQGRVGDLRRTTLTTLRAQRDWARQRTTLPSHYYMHG